MKLEQFVEQDLFNLRPGDHLCSLYADVRQHGAILARFLAGGFAHGQKVIYISDDHAPENLLAPFNTEIGRIEDALAQGRLALVMRQETGLSQAGWNPQAAIDWITAEMDQAAAAGYASVRFAGEMSWVLQGETGPAPVIEYEAGLEALAARLQTKRATFLCLYDRRKWDPGILMDVLHCHPKVAVGAAVCENAYYIPPKTLFGADHAAAKLDQMLAHLARPSSAQDIAWRERAERERAEQALQESEQALRKRDAQFRSLVQYSPFGILLTDEDGIVIEYNASAEKIYQRAAESALGRSFWDVRADSLSEDQRSPAAYQQLKETLQDYYRTGTAPWLYRFEERELIWPDGQTRTIQRVRFPIPTERGFMLASISRDVTKQHKIELELEQYRHQLEAMVEQRTAELQHEIRERQKVEEVLRESEGRYRALVNQAPLSIMVIQGGHFVFANPAIVQRLGYASAYDLIGRNIRDIITPESQDKYSGSWIEPAITAFRCKDGSLYHLENTSVPILYQGQPAVLLIGQDVSERLRYEQQLKSSLAEKEVMLREIHHRVKNNLNVIIALMDLQKAAQHDTQALLVFRELQTRVYSMALVHESLYRSPNLAQVDFAGYLQTLVSYLYSAYRPAENMPGTLPVFQEVEVEDVTLKIEAAIPCGLIVNELVTNAMKYAFPPGYACSDPAGCRITVRLERLSGSENRPEENGLRLTVRDNGAGLPAGFDWRASPTLGLQLVQVLVRQLGGQIKLETERGVSWNMTFPSQRQG